MYLGTIRCNRENVLKKRNAIAIQERPIFMQISFQLWKAHSLVCLTYPPAYLIGVVCVHLKDNLNINCDQVISTWLESIQQVLEWKTINWPNQSCTKCMSKRCSYVIRMLILNLNYGRYIYNHVNFGPRWWSKNDVSLKLCNSLLNFTFKVLACIQ